MSKNFKVRDRRNKGWFFIDNEYINGYGKFFGPVGIAIYVCLCRHANGEQICFPSQELIAEKIGVNSRTVRRYLNRFIQYNMIHVEKERKGGRWLNNIYYLLDKDEWSTPSDTVSSGTIGLKRHSPSDIKDSNHRTLCPTKDTNRKDTNKKERKVKSSEERINPIKKEIESLVTSFKVPN